MAVLKFPVPVVFPHPEGVCDRQVQLLVAAQITGGKAVAVVPLVLTVVGVQGQQVTAFTNQDLINVHVESFLYKTEEFIFDQKSPQLSPKNILLNSEWVKYI